MSNRIPVAMQLVNELSDIDLDHVPEFDGDFDDDINTDMAPPDPMWGAANGSASSTDDGAENPFAAANRSGARQVPTDGTKVLLCRAVCKNNNGLASIQVNLTYGDLVGAAVPGRIPRLDVRWRTGGAGGQAYVDATAGTVFTVGGAETIEVYIEQFRAGGSATTAWEMYAECIVSWGGSISPKAAYYSLPPVSLIGGGGASDQLEVPSQANSMIVLADNSNAYAGMIAKFSRDQSVTPTTHISVTNPFANGCPLVSGARYFTLESTVTCEAIPVFELYL